MAVSFDFNFWVILISILNFGYTLFVAASNRNKAAHEELNGLRASLGHDVTRISERVSVLEAKQDNGITHDDIAAVHKRVDTLLEKVGNISGSMQEMSSTLTRLSSAMMKQFP